MTPRLNRRAALIAAAGSFAAPVLMTAPAHAAEDPVTSLPLTPWRSFQLGGMMVTPLLAGTRVLEKPHETFGTNVPDKTFDDVSHAAFLPTDKSLNFFIPILVETGRETVLFDTGLTPDGITAALKAAGKSPEDIDIVVITHMHGDHIGGLMDGTKPVFPNARYVTGKQEWDYWSGAANESFNNKARPLAEKFTFLDDGGVPFEGATAILAAGHTPGHMVYRLNSGDEALILTADTANHYVWSLGHPDWEVRFDMDKPAAAETRQRILGMIADERLPFIGYHMPFPGAGYLNRTDKGFEFVPLSYQLNL